jgi:molybdopterin-guanine dinucleotide biosynthesis protein A
MARLSALVLAGKRDGALDPLAASDKVSHKCLVDVGRKPMLTHPIETLASSSSVGKIYVSIDDPSVLDGIPLIGRLRAERRLEMVRAHHNLVDSVLAAAKAAQFPLLITTADNVLLTPSAVEELDTQARENGADAAVAFARRESVLAAHPDGQRRFYNFSCGAYSNCNLYWLGTDRALSAAEVFRSGGQFAKHPSRIVSAFGLVNLLRFRFGIGTLEGGFARFSRRLGLTISPVVIADGQVAIDVDNQRTRAVVEEILARRHAEPIAA